MGAAISLTQIQEYHLAKYNDFRIQAESNEDKAEASNLKLKAIYHLDAYHLLTSKGRLSTEIQMGACHD